MPNSKMYNNYPIQNNPIQIGVTWFHPWPNFSISGLAVDVPNRLRHLLCSEEAEARKWRKHMPRDVVHALLIFDSSLLTELIILAQQDPAKFVDWANFCPALIILALENNRFGANVDTERTLSLMNEGWRSVLNACKWPARRAMLRILQKMSPEYARPQLLKHLRLHLRDRRKTKLMSHLSRINNQTLDTLHLSNGLLSVRLLEVATQRKGLVEAPLIRDLCLELLGFRKEVGLSPLWPYRKGQISEESLYNAEQLMLMRRSMGSISGKVKFPRAPIEAFKSSRLEVQPIKTPGELHHEGIKMRNCLPGYAANIASGAYYAYRIIHPERATLLLSHSQKGWVPWQVKTNMNGDVDPKTKKLVETWLGMKFPRKEVLNAPF